MFATNATRLAGAAALTLGWRPAEFWAATPAELANIVAALSASTAHAAAPPDRADISALMEMFPDEPSY